MEADKDRRQEKNNMYDFLICFYVLDYCFFENRINMMKEDDLGVLLGEMDPNMTEDGMPIDRAVLDDWNYIVQISIEPSNDTEFITLIDNFLKFYEENEGFSFPLARKVIKEKKYLEYMDIAKNKASATCKLYNYQET